MWTVHFSGKAVERDGVNTPNPGPEFVLRAGDRLLVFGGGEAIGRLRALLAATPEPA